MVSTQTNPYLSINKKYFKSTFDGQFIITTSDLINMPELKNYVNVSYLINNELNFGTFDDSLKIKIGLIFFNYYEYIIWKGIKKYLDLSKLIQKFKMQEKLIYQLTKLKNYFYYKNDPSTNLYDVDQLDSKFLLLLITEYFYSKYSVTKVVEKYIEHTDILTDVNLNQNHYNKVQDNILFIVHIFNNWIKTSHNTIPFSPGYGNPLKELIQEKNNLVRLSMVKEEISNFFQELSKIYPSLIEVQNVNVNILNTYGIEIIISLSINKTPVTFNVVPEETFI